ncbi:hypothetical protein [Anaerotignum faecicola]|nr:hypothetical protein [Tyzzerella sp.]
MNYLVEYDFNNFNETFDCVPGVRNGVTFDFLDCRIKINTLGESLASFWINGEITSIEEAKSKLNQCIKLLSYIFSLPFYEKGKEVCETQNVLEQNSLLGKNNKERLILVEKYVRKLSSRKDFFEETLDLIIVAIDNLYKDREEDAFMYFFKVIERIAKEHYHVYAERHHKKNIQRENKKKLREFIDNYARDTFHIEFTKDMLDGKTGELYKELERSYYGNIYSKISLFISLNKFNGYDADSISHMVKTRNKLAHGDLVDKEMFEASFAQCEYLAMQMFSKYFFHVEYEKIHIKSQRTKGFEPYKK